MAESQPQNAMKCVHAKDYEWKSKMGMKIEKCGLYISEAFPMVAGSPDGINNKTTFEMKSQCPSSDKTTQNYIDDNGTILNKYFAQVQMQIYCAKGNKSYFWFANGVTSRAETAWRLAFLRKNSKFKIKNRC